MGQRIEVLGTSVIGEVAIFDTDRSLGGMEGETYATIEDASSGSTYPAGLAERLMRQDESIRLVYVYSNALSVSRAGGWTDGAIAQVAAEITNFFIVYADNKA